jgi:hypothetical protein
VDANVSWSFVLVEGGEKVWCLDGDIMGQVDGVSEGCNAVADVVDGVMDFVGEGGFWASFAVEKVVAFGIKVAIAALAWCVLEWWWDGI